MDRRLTAAIQRIDYKLNRLAQMVELLLEAASIEIHKETQIMATLTEALAIVRQEQTEADSVKALLEQLTALIKAQVPGLTPEQQAQIDAIVAEGTAANQEIADAIIANTPSAP